MSAHKLVFHSFASHCSVKLHWCWTILYKTCSASGRHNPSSLKNCSRAAGSAAWGIQGCQQGEIFIYLNIIWLTEKKLIYRERQPSSKLPRGWTTEGLESFKHLLPYSSSAHCLHSPLNSLLHFPNPSCLCHYILKVSVSKSKKSGKLSEAGKWQFLFPRAKIALNWLGSHPRFLGPLDIIKQQSHDISEM